jgi:hypothetical protein
VKKLIVFALFALGISFAATANADSPHWIAGAIHATLETDWSLTVDFTIAGLGNTLVDTEVDVTADATAVWECRTKSGNTPKDPKKTVVAGPVVAGGFFANDGNGNVSGTLVLYPPAVDPGFCPGGQVETLTSAAYQRVTLRNILAGLYFLGDFSASL